MSARAKTDLQLCILTRENIEKLIEIEPRIASSLMKNAAQVIAGLREQLYGKG